jgi:AraC-like DNA-binding protein
MPKDNNSDPRLARKDEFLAQISGHSHFDQLFGHLPGVAFFVKNAAFQLQAANREFWSRLGVDSEAALVGKTDFDLFPQRLAENFRRDDIAVMKSGRPMHDILELFFDAQSLPDWYLTTKLPVFDHAGTVIGVMGTVRSFAGERQLRSSMMQLDRAVEYLRANFRSQIRMSDLASRCGMSVRQFNRRFRETFNITPNAFLIKTRIHAACELLRDSGTPICEIAEQLGFYDQSSFTLHFRRHMGTTPYRYRRLTDRSG